MLLNLQMARLVSRNNFERAYTLHLNTLLRPYPNVAQLSGVVSLAACPSTRRD